MADYMCKHCKYNNNGWCVAKKKNRLSEVLECDTFKEGKYGNFVSMPSDGKERSYVGVKTVFLSDGTFDTKHMGLSIKAARSRGTISFFTQEDKKIGLSMKIEDLEEFLKSL